MCDTGKMASAPSRMPFIMPDGSRLTHMLGMETEPARNGKSKRGTKSRKSPYERRMQINFNVGSETDAAEVTAAYKLGARRRLRWLNDRLLRQMAGPMTAQEMMGLFNPVPFGEVRVSPLQVAMSEAPQLWERLRNIDMEREALVFQKWEEHNAAQHRANKPSKACTATAAVGAWQRVGKKARTVLRKMDMGLVHAFEEEVVHFLLSGESALCVECSDAFERCALHGICAFYGLLSHGVDTEHGRAVRVRRPARYAPAAEASGTTGAAVLRDASSAQGEQPRPWPVSGSDAVDEDADEDADAALPASAAADGAISVAAGAAAAESPAPAGEDERGQAGGAPACGLSSAAADGRFHVMPVTVVDILLILENQDAGRALNRSALNEHMMEHAPR